MRIIESINDKRFKISYYNLDRFYYMEIEAGPMKQCYKFSKEKHPDYNQLKIELNQGAFFDEVYKHFESMFMTLKGVN